MASWDEVRLLAADLRRVQSGDSAKRLSNRNCVELVAKLIADGRLEVITTVNGKEYITPQHLCTEIHNELIGNEGRVAIGDIQNGLHVEYRTVEEYANRLASEHPDVTVCLGQLISREYVDKIANEIDDDLQRKGKMTLAEITQHYDLPTDFVNDHVMVHLGKRIRGFTFAGNAGVLYTNAYIDAQVALLRGALFGCTRLLPVKKLVTEFGVEASLIFKCFDSLQARGFGCGSIVNGHQIDRAVYVPDFFMDQLANHLADFYHQNNYIVYSYVRKFGVSDYQQVINRALAKDDLVKTTIALKECLISNKLFGEIEAMAEECLKEDLWLQVNAVTPSALSEVDAEELFKKIAKGHPDWLQASDGNFFKADLVSRCALLFDGMIAEKAEKEGPNLTRSEVQPPAKDKGGGKKAPTRGKKKKGADEGDEERVARKGLVFMSEQEVACSLQRSTLGLQACPTAILNDVADRLVTALNAKYRAKVDSVLLSASDGQRKSHGEIVDKIHSLYATLRLSQIALCQFDEGVGGQLTHHLLRSLATDIAHLALADFANIPNPLQMTAKARNAAVKELPSPGREHFENLIASLAGQTLEPFYDAMDRVALPNICSLNLRCPDKKSRANVVAKYADDLKSQLRSTEDCASALHLCSLLLFNKYTDHLLHASGKFVPALIAALGKKVPEEIWLKLCKAQSDVVAVLKKDIDSDEAALQSIAELKAVCL